MVRAAGGAHARRRAALKGHRLQHGRLRIRRGRRPACRADRVRLSENRLDPAAGLCRHAKSEEFCNAGDRRSADIKRQNRSFLDKACYPYALITDRLI